MKAGPSLTFSLILHFHLAAQKKSENKQLKALKIGFILFSLFSDLAFQLTDFYSADTLTFAFNFSPFCLAKPYISQRP